jgi:serine/threonine-protein kinase RIO1
VATLIDFPQAVDPKKNRFAQSLLERDVHRICEHFERFGLRRNAAAIAADLWTGWLHADLVPEELRGLSSDAFSLLKGPADPPMPEPWEAAKTVSSAKVEGEPSA